jgi:hypothetical protein
MSSDDPPRPRLENWDKEAFYVNTVYILDDVNRHSVEYLMEMDPILTEFESFSVEVVDPLSWMTAAKIALFVKERLECTEDYWKRLTRFLVELLHALSHDPEGKEEVSSAMSQCGLTREKVIAGMITCLMDERISGAKGS